MKIYNFWHSLFHRKIFISLLLIVPVGLATKFYRGPAAWWFNDYLGGVFYEIFWCLFFAFILPNVSAFLISIWVFLVTCALEFLQLWHPPFLEMIRSTFIGRAFIGHAFAWSDFPYYIIGSVIGWYWIIMIKKKCNKNS
jgi:hypothetical protein